MGGGVPEETVKKGKRDYSSRRGYQEEVNYGGLLREEKGAAGTG